MEQTDIEEPLLMNTYEIEEWAKDHGFDSAEFTMIVKSNGRIVQGKFLDAYYGMILIPEIGDGFILLRQLREMFGNDGVVFIPHSVSE